MSEKTNEAWPDWKVIENLNKMVEQLQAENERQREVLERSVAFMRRLNVVFNNEAVKDVIDDLDQALKEPTHD